MLRILRPHFSSKVTLEGWSAEALFSRPNVESSSSRVRRSNITMGAKKVYFVTKLKLYTFSRSRAPKSLALYFQLDKIKIEFQVGSWERERKAQIMECTL